MLEALTIIGELIGSIAILFIPFNSVNGYLIFCFVNAVAGIVLFFPRSMGSKELRDFLVILTLFIQSFCVSALGYTQVIFSHYYDENSEKYEHSIWNSLTFLGEVISIIAVQYALYSLKIQWEWAKMIWALYMLLIGVVMYFYLDDHSEPEI
jgi:sugar phosphate permease